MRAKLFGYIGGHSLYRAISCNRFIPDIETPTFVLTAKDDPITKFKFVPVSDIERNPNMILATTSTGTHCDYLSTVKDPETGRHLYYEHYFKHLAMKFFERVEMFNEEES